MHSQLSFETLMAELKKNLIEFKNKVNQPLTILGFSGPDFLQSRLKQMGLHLGQSLQIVGQAPFSGPLLLRVGPVVLALRPSEAQCISVKDGQ